VVIAVIVIQIVFHFDFQHAAVLKATNFTSDFANLPP